MNVRKIKKSDKGSSTIETALVISAIILILVTLIYSSLIMYQKVLLTKTAQYIAQQGATIWTDSKKNIDSGSIVGKRDEMSLSELYYQILDDSLFTGKVVSEELDVFEGMSDSKELGKNSSQDEKFLKMRKAVRANLSKSLLKPSSTILEIKYDNSFIERKVRITLKQEIKPPFGGIKSFFNGKESMTLSGVGTATIVEPEEYIRNMDFIKEYIAKTGVISSLGQRIDGLKGKLAGGNK